MTTPDDGDSGGMELVGLTERVDHLRDKLHFYLSRALTYVDKGDPGGAINSFGSDLFCNLGMQGLDVLILDQLMVRQFMEAIGRGHRGAVEALAQEVGLEPLPAAGTAEG